MTRKTRKTEKVADRAARIADTWNDPAVRAARSTRTKVRVGKDVYRSFREAVLFTAPELDHVHIALRMTMKREGKVTAAGHTFVAVQGE